MTPSSLIAAALEPSGTRITDDELARTLRVLSEGRSVAVAGTMMSGRVELVRALAAGADVPVVSTLYAQHGAPPPAGAAAALETIGAVTTLDEVDNWAVPGSAWACLEDRPAPLRGLLLLDGTTWSLTTL